MADWRPPRSRPGGHVHRRRRRSRRRPAGAAAARLPAVPPHVARRRARRSPRPASGPSPSTSAATRRACARRRSTPTRPTRLVADVLDLADALGAERFHLVGHDWGGQVAWLTAAHHPDRVASLTVLSRPHPAAFARSFALDPEQADALAAPPRDGPGDDRPLARRRLAALRDDARPRRRAGRRRRRLPRGRSASAPPSTRR